MKSFIEPLTEQGIIVSLFVDPDFKQVEASSQTGAQFIELHTGQYAELFNTDEENAAFKNLEESSRICR